MIIITTKKGSSAGNGKTNITSVYTDGGNYVFSERVWWAGGNR